MNTTTFVISSFTWERVLTTTRFLITNKMEPVPPKIAPVIGKLDQRFSTDRSRTGCGRSLCSGRKFRQVLFHYFFPSFQTPSPSEYNRLFSAIIRIPKNNVLRNKLAKVLFESIDQNVISYYYFYFLTL